MKNIIQKCAVFMVICIAMVLAGCNSGQKEARPSSLSISSSSSSESYYAEQPSFSQEENKLFLVGMTLGINEIEILPVGSEKNLESVPVVVVYYSVSNYSREDINPYEQWMSHTTVFQGMDADTTHSLLPASINLKYTDSGENVVLATDDMGSYAVSFKLESADLPIGILFESGDKSVQEIATFQISDLTDLPITNSDFESHSNENAGEDNTSKIPSKNESDSPAAPSVPSKAPSNPQTSPSSSVTPESPSVEQEPPKKNEPDTPAEGTDSKSESSQNQGSTITVSQENALEQAKNYLSFSAFSRSGLIDQLEFEGYSTQDATYAVDHCGANWNEQALKNAKSYLSIMPFSYSGLIEQLEYDQYTSEQAAYGANNCGANWNEQAVKAAKNYLDIMSFSRDKLISQLEYDGFTHEQAVYGVNAAGL